MLLYKEIIKYNAMLILEKNLKKLPILPNIVTLLLNLKSNENYDTKKLLELIHRDPILTSRILHLANSKFFGFTNTIDTPGQAISLYGMNFTIAVCISEIVNNTLKFDLDAYDITYNKFNLINELSFKVMLDWLDESDAELKEDLIIPIFLHNIGKFIISSYLKQENKINKFKAIYKNSDISKVERDFVGMSSCELSSMVLKDWGFDQKSLDMIFYMENPYLNTSNKKAVSVLSVINTLCSFKRPMSSDNIQLALLKAKDYDLDFEKLKNVIDRLSINYKNS